MAQVVEVVVLHRDLQVLLDRHHDHLGHLVLVLVRLSEDLAEEVLVVDDHQQVDNYLFL